MELATLKEIGDMLGGLLEIANETLNLSCFQYAKIRCRGCASGFIEPIMILGKSLRLGIFNLGAPTGFFQEQSVAELPVSSSESPEESLASASIHAPRVDPVTEKENKPISSGIDENNFSLGEREKIGVHNDCEQFPGLDARNKGKMVSNNHLLEKCAYISSGSFIGDNSSLPSSLPRAKELGCCSFVGPIIPPGPNGKVKLSPHTQSELEFLNESAGLVPSAEDNKKAFSAPVGHSLPKPLGKRKWRPKEKLEFKTAVITRWEDFLAQKKIAPRPRNSGFDYDSDSDLMRDRNHGRFFTRRRREDQEATSVFRLGLDCDPVAGSVEIAGEEEIGLIDSDGDSDLDGGSSEDSFSSSGEEVSPVLEECLEGLSLILGEDQLAMIPVDAEASLSPKNPAPLDIRLPPEGAFLSQQGFFSPEKEIETSSKQNRIKGRDRELRNLEIEMSFGKAKESGAKSSYQ